MAKLFDVKGVTAPTAEGGTTGGSKNVSTDQVVRNPFNRRRVDPAFKAVKDMMQSLQEQKQIHAAVVVTSSAFLMIFPEQAEHVGTHPFVLLAGEVRLTACRELGRDLEIAVKDEFAATPETWMAATAVENLKRTDLNAVEEAESVADVVRANANNQSEAGRKLGVDRSWVAHRMAILKLAPRTKDLARKHGIAVREIRGSLHNLPEDEQVAYVQHLMKLRQAVTAVTEEPGDEQSPAPTPAQRQPTERVTPVMRAVERLHKQPLAKVGETLRARLSPDERRAWAAELLQGL